MKNTFISSCDFHKSVALSETFSSLPQTSFPPYCCNATLRCCKPGEAKNPKNDQMVNDCAWYQVLAQIKN